MVKNSSNRVRIGVTISQMALCAADARFRDMPGGVWRAPLDPPPPDAAWTSLASALADLAERVGAKEGELVVSLVSPLTEVRRIELPPVRDDDLQRLLARGASRYFVNARSPQIVGASPAGKRARGVPLPMIAAAAPARLIVAIKHAAQQSGWTVSLAAPAESAWAAAVFALWPTFARQRAFALVAHEDRTDLLGFEDQQLMSVRRFRAGADDVALIADAVGSGTRAGILGSISHRKSLATALGARGVTVSTPAGEWADAAESAEALAAHFAGSPIGPVLRSEEALIAERSRANRRALQIAGVAAVLFATAGAIEFWGVHRQLALVRAERERLRPEISKTMVGRTTVEAAYRHLTSLSAVDAKAPRWSAVIGTVSKVLPDDAFLLSLRTRDDSLIVDGLADRASRVFNSLEKANGLTNVRASAPVRRELQDGGTSALEHFTIAARVVPPADERKSK